jgi:hypothetical protein
MAPWRLPYRCDGCDKTAEIAYVPPERGGTDGSARVQGWRLGWRGPEHSRVLTRICPACAGGDPTYWLRWHLDRLSEADLIAAGLDPKGPDYAEQVAELAEEIERHDADDDTVVAA